MKYPFSTENGLNWRRWCQIATAIKKLPKGKWEIVIQRQTRTLPQNNSLHKYCADRAEQMNDAGVSKVFALSLLRKELPWSGDTVKEEIWRVFQTHLGFPESTTKLKTDQVTKIYELCTLFFGEKLNLPLIPFPDQFSKDLKKL